MEIAKLIYEARVLLERARFGAGHAQIGGVIVRREPALEVAAALLQIVAAQQQRIDEIYENTAWLWKPDQHRGSFEGDGGEMGEFPPGRIQCAACGGTGTTPAKPSDADLALVDMCDALADEWLALGDSRYTAIRGFARKVQRLERERYERDVLPGKLADERERIAMSFGPDEQWSGRAIREIIRAGGQAMSDRTGPAKPSDDTKP